MYFVALQAPTRRIDPPDRPEAQGGMNFWLLNCDDLLSGCKRPYENRKDLTDANPNVAVAYNSIRTLINQ